MTDDFELAGPSSTKFKSPFLRWSFVLINGIESRGTGEFTALAHWQMEWYTVYSHEMLLALTKDVPFIFQIKVR
jgi:hypothetical protein